MNDNFSPRVKNVVNSGKLEAIRLKHSAVGTEHLLLGLLLTYSQRYMLTSLF